MSRFCTQEDAIQTFPTLATENEAGKTLKGAVRPSSAPLFLL